MSEVGDIVKLQGDEDSDYQNGEVEVIMTIKRGHCQLTLFRPVEVSSIYTSYVYDKQAEAIKSFMENGRESK